MKKKGIAIVAILLVIAIAAGALFMYNRSKNDTTFDNSFGGISWDDLFGDDFISGDDTSASDDTSSSNETTSTPADARLIDADGYGYQTVGGSTAFFKLLELTAEEKSKMSTCTYYDVRYPYHECVPYSSFTLNVKWSLDGILWNDFKGQIINDDPNVSGDFWGQCANLSTDCYSVYVSYTFVDNCASPILVLNDLKSNVFTVDGMFEPRLNAVFPVDSDVGRG